MEQLYCLLMSCLNVHVCDAPPPPVNHRPRPTGEAELLKGELQHQRERLPDV